MQPKDIVCNIEQHVFNNTALITHSLYDLLTTRIGQRCSLRPSVLGQDRSQNKKSVSVLVLQVYCCVVKHGVVTVVVIMILKDTATFQVLFIVSLFCAWNTVL